MNPLTLPHGIRLGTGDAQSESPSRHYRARRAMSKAMPTAAAALMPFISATSAVHDCLPVICVGQGFTVERSRVRVEGLGLIYVKLGALRV